MRFIEPAACPTNLFFSLALAPRIQQGVAPRIQQGVAPRIQQGVVPCTDVGTCILHKYTMLARTIYSTTTVNSSTK